MSFNNDWNNTSTTRIQKIIGLSCTIPEAALTGNTCAFFFFFRVSTATAEDTHVPTTARILDDIGHGGTKNDYAVLLHRVISEPSNPHIDELCSEIDTPTVMLEVQS